MQQTTNYKFNLPEDTDVVDISKINANFTAIDSLLKDGTAAIVSITLPKGRMRGDVDGDGKFTQNDADLINQYANGKIELTADQLKAGDINKDGEVDTRDATQIVRIINGKSKPGTYGPDTTGKWTNNPNAATETAQFYTDVTVSKITASKSAIIIASGTFESDFFVKAECLAGKIRVWTTLVPINDISCTLIFGDGNGKAVIVPTNIDLSTINEQLESYVPKEQVSNITIYDSLADLSMTATSALVDIFNAMKSPSRLMCNITGGSTSIYPSATGVLTIDKVDANNGTATFTFGDGEVVTGTFSASA